MDTVWKCSKCEYGPCYTGSHFRPQPDPFGIETDENRPMFCPYFWEESADFEMCAPEVRPHDLRYLDEMQEWLMGEGYDAAPEKIRDVICAFGLIPSGFSADRALEILNLLRNFEQDRKSGLFDREEFARSMAKIKKTDLVDAIFPEAFKAGICYAEMVRQKEAK